MTAKRRPAEEARRRVLDARARSLALRKPTASDRVILAVSCVVSALVGVYLMWSMHRYDEAGLFLLVGLAHSIVLAGTLWYIRISAMRAALYLTVCALFPWWGMFVGMVGIIIFSSITCSLAWGGLLAYLFKDPLALILMVVIGSIPAAYLYLTVAPGGVVPDWFFPGEIAFWHATASPAVAWLGVRYRSKRLTTGESQCELRRDPHETIGPNTRSSMCRLDG